MPEAYRAARATLLTPSDARPTFWAPIMGHIHVLGHVWYSGKAIGLLSGGEVYVLGVRVKS